MEKRGLEFTLVLELILVLFLIFVKETGFGYTNRTSVLLIAVLILGGALFMFYLNHGTKLPLGPHWITEVNAVVLVFVFITELAGYQVEIISSLALVLLLVSIFFVYSSKVRKSKQIIHHHTREVIHKEKRESSRLIGSTNGKKAHYQSCIVGKRIPKEKMKVFKSKKDALEKGYKLCELCVHKES